MCIVCAYGFTGFANAIGVSEPGEKLKDVCNRLQTSLELNSAILRGNSKLYEKRYNISQDSKLDGGVEMYALPSALNVETVLVCVQSRCV